MKRGISIVLALYTAFMSCAATALVFEPGAPIRMNSQPSVSSAISVSISYDESAASNLEYEWTYIDGAWAWVPMPYTVEFTVINQSICCDATVTLDAPSQLVCSSGHTASGFALDGAQLGVSASESGTISQSVSTGTLSCEYCTKENYAPVNTNEQLYYRIVPANGKYLTNEQASSVESETVTSVLTFSVSATEHTHQQGEMQ